jgi:hypothetical protein
MAQSMIGSTSWIRLAVFALLVVALASVPVRGCAHNDAALEDDSSAARALPVEPKE